MFRFRKVKETAPLRAQIAPNINATISERKFSFFKWWGFFFAITLSALGIIYLSYKVFPDSYEVYIIIVLISWGIAAGFTFGSRWATSATADRIVNAHFWLMIALATNLAAHMMLSREKSMAIQATTERHLEEDRAEQRKDAEAKRWAEVMGAQSGLATAESKRYANQAASYREARRLGLPKVRQFAAPSLVNNLIQPNYIASVEPASVGPAAAVDVSRLSVGQVMEKWQGRLTWLAILDLATSLVAYGWVLKKWERDFNRNGIPDYLERP